MPNPTIASRSLTDLCARIESHFTAEHPTAHVVFRHVSGGRYRSDHPQADKINQPFFRAQVLSWGGFETGVKSLLCTKGCLTVEDAAERALKLLETGAPLHERGSVTLEVQESTHLDISPADASTRTERRRD